MISMHDDGVAQQIELLSSGVKLQVPPNGIEQKLRKSWAAGTQLVIKLGVDPTAPDLHLGHGVVLRKLKQFQDAGHKIVLIIGDATARIGDPTGRNSARPPLSNDDIQRNSETYLAQLGKFLDLSRVSIRRNSEWLDGINLQQLIQEFSRLTLGQIMQRRDFSERQLANIPISMHELVYPILQGYDSVAIGADIELGGTDQLFNNQVGRWLQEARGLEGQTVLCMPLLVGLDGKDKMSKSKNNYIAISDSSADIYGKVMSLPDSVLGSYLQLTSDFSTETLETLLHELKAATVNPMVIKKRLARQLVSRFYTEDEAARAEDSFARNFQNRDGLRHYEPRQISSELWGRVSVVQLCQTLEPTRSRSEIRRLIQDHAVEIDGRICEDIATVVETREVMTLRIGKKGFYALQEG